MTKYFCDRCGNETTEQLSADTWDGAGNHRKGVGLCLRCVVEIERAMKTRPAANSKRKK